MSFSHLDGRPVHVLSELDRLLRQFMEKAFDTSRIRLDTVRVLPEEGGLLCAMPIDAEVDSVVEWLPESLAKQLARHNKSAGEPARLKAILSFTWGPTEESGDRLIGPSRDRAVRQAELREIQACLADAAPGTVAVVLDGELFQMYVQPEFGQNLNAEDFTNIPANPPAWYRIIYVSVPHGRNGRSPARSRRLLLLLAATLLVLSGVAWWKLHGDDDERPQRKPALIIHGQCDRIGALLTSTSSGFTPGGPYTDEVLDPTGKPYGGREVPFMIHGKATARGTVGWQWLCEKGDLKGTYRTRVTDDTTGQSTGWVEFRVNVS